MIRIALAEDNVFLQNSIREKLSFFEGLNFCYAALNGRELLEQLDQDRSIDVVLMDIQMPEMDGIEATSKLKAKYPHVKVIMLTVFDDEENVFRAIQAGADGYLLKETGPEELQQGILEMMEGGAPMTPSIAAKALKLLRNPELASSKSIEGDTYTLSKRETEVLEQISKGLNYMEIAENLFISPATVRKHIENIYKKLQVHNKIEAVQKARESKLI